MAQRQAEVARKKAARADAAHTVLDLFEAWMAKKNCSEVYRGNIRAAFVKDVLPEIGSMQAPDVTRQHVLNILRKLEHRGALVLLRRVRMWLQQLYEFALDADRVAASPVPTGHLKSFMQPDEKHFPAITNVGDVAKLMRAIRSYDHTVVRTALLLSAHLFQRPGEVRMSAVTEFDLEKARWQIPAQRMKKRREHWVPIPGAVGRTVRTRDPEHPARCRCPCP